MPPVPPPPAPAAPPTTATPLIVSDVPPAPATAPPAAPLHAPAAPPTTATPLIVSASRATDLPAFHASWFMERLRAGHCARVHPRDARRKTIISFAACRAFVFWSKNPTPLLPHLAEIEARGYRFYFQYTLNDYENEGLEPRLPSLSRRLDAFRRLADRIGPERVVWRFDPLIVGDRLPVDALLERVRRIGDALKGATEKLVFSFLDLYRGTRSALGRVDPSLRAPTEQEMLRLAEGVSVWNAARSRPLSLAACAEGLDLSGLGIAKNACVDAALLLRLCPGDAALAALFRNGGRPDQGSLFRNGTCLEQASLFCNENRPEQVRLLRNEGGPEQTNLLRNGGRPEEAAQPGARPLVARKDPGQRPACGCAPSRDIGAYDTCMHLCAYCYANHSEKKIIANMNRRVAGAETLCGTDVEATDIEAVGGVSGGGEGA